MSKKIGFDELLHQIGEFGKYQRYVYFMVCLVGIWASFNTMIMVFTAAGMDAWCRAPTQLINATNFTTFELRNLTVPFDYEAGTWASCELHERNYSSLEKLDEWWTTARPPDNNSSDSSNETNAAQPTTTACVNGWEFDRSQYRSTIASEWNLVCSEKIWVTTSKTIYMAGLMIGVVTTGMISDNFGRKVSIYLSLLVNVSAGIGCAFVPSFMGFMILRFLVAAGTIGMFTSGFVMVVELVGPQWRVFTGIVIEYFWALGYIILALLAYLIRDWRQLQLCTSASTVVLLLLYYFLPESPRWLIMRGETEKAHKILEKLSEVNGTPLPAGLDISVERQPRASIIAILRPPRLRRRALNIFFNWFVNSMVYYGLSLNTSDLAGDPYLNFALSGAIEFPAYALCHVVLQRCGRRLPLAGCLCFGGVALLLILQVPANAAWMVTILSMAGKFTITASFGIIYVFSAELFPTVCRNEGLGVSSTFARVGGILATQAETLKYISPNLHLLTFGAMSILAGLLTFLLPETRGKALPETIEEGDNFGVVVAKNTSTQTGDLWTVIAENEKLEKFLSERRDVLVDTRL